MRSLKEIVKVLSKRKANHKPILKFDKHVKISGAIVLDAADASQMELRARDDFTILAFHITSGRKTQN